MKEIAVELRNISKSFGKVKANEDVSFIIYKGEVLSLLGENGSGKTTLMNMLSGIYYPDEGQIFVNGKEAKITSPKDAYALNIGMVHQHFKLIDTFTALENIVLGLKSTGRNDMVISREKAREICERYNFDLDLDQRVADMNVSQKQTLEIVKTLYRGAEILILDEPTSVLTPQETDKLFEVIRNMKSDNKTIIIITHKLNEVLEISDRVTILRKGRYIDTVATTETSIQQLTDMMVGEKVELDIERPEVTNRQLRLTVTDLSVYNSDGRKVLDKVSFEAYGGEILGIAGISGCGQKELLEAIAGLQPTAEGSSVYFKDDGKKPEELIGKRPQDIAKLGVHLSFVPEDRLGMGLVGNMNMVENMMLKNYRDGVSPFLSRKVPTDLAADIKKKLEVETPSINYNIRNLSGGNVQKVLVGREIALGPKVLMTAYAVRGLDINTSYTIYHLLNEQKKEGVAVIYVGEDLDVLLALSDRIMVLCSGKVNGILDGRTATKDQVGLLMTTLQEEKEDRSCIL